MDSTASPLVIINVVGLTPSLLGTHTPHLSALARDGFLAPLRGVFPAVTCPTQSSMVTGTPPSKHGIVANGWYFRELAEVWFWRQSNHLVQGEKIWEAARRDIPDFTCAKLFWWYNMYASVDYSVTPRPIYPADGRKIPAIYTHPSDLGMRLEEVLGPFPMFHFWGPTAGIRSSEWIAASAEFVFDAYRPNLLLVYLPHLDYNLQRLGPADAAIEQDLTAIDRVAGTLIDHVRGAGADVLVLSEYGIEQAAGHIHVNRLLREHGYLATRSTLGWELLDPGASAAFAVADHQAAHVYVADPRDILPVKRLLGRTPGIAMVLDGETKPAWGLDHERTGELVALAEPGYWFTYYYWMEDSKAPDFARTVDIHRKPGYDPLELFIDPKLRLPGLRIGWRLLRKTLGFCGLMDVIPLDPSLVKGTHGRLPDTPEHGPLLIASRPIQTRDSYSMLDIKPIALSLLRSARR